MRRSRWDTLVWLGAGLLVGALLLAIVTMVANRGRHGDGLLDEAGGWWIASVAIALPVLVFGARWRATEPRTPTEEPEG